ncbi:unnamed protein product [Peronospora effusa]|nr:unnamed protein product [Peronospora effusa]
MPTPGLNSPVNVSFSPDGRIVAFLHAPGPQSSFSRQLYVLDVASRRVPLLAASPGKGTEDNMSFNEKLRRERQRQMGVGITSYAWNPSPHSHSWFQHCSWYSCPTIFSRRDAKAPIILRKTT